MTEHICSLFHVSIISSVIEAIKRVFLSNNNTYSLLTVKNISKWQNMIVVSKNQDTKLCPHVEISPCHRLEKVLLFSYIQRKSKENQTFVREMSPAFNVWCLENRKKSAEVGSHQFTLSRVAFSHTFTRKQDVLFKCH